MDYDVATNPLEIDGSKIEFVETAEHVGLLRASSGNLPTILEKFSSHNCLFLKKSSPSLIKARKHEMLFG